MKTHTFSDSKIRSFLRELLDSDLAIEVYAQLMADGGNTAIGISDNLKEKGVRASKTRVYEEISLLVQLGLIKRVSNRPPIYTTIHSQENLEQVAMKLMRRSREEILRSWAAAYPFLPAELKSRNSKIGRLTGGGQLFNFNPYPVVDIYTSELAELKRYMLRVFSSRTILVSHNIIDTMFEASNFYRVFKDENFESFFKLIKSNNERFGRMTVNSISNVISDDLKEIIKTKKFTPFNEQFFNFVNYELRLPTNELSSFILGDNNLIYPVGVGGVAKKTFVFIEIQEPEIVESAKFTFENSWKNAKPVIKIENGKIIDI